MCIFDYDTPQGEVRAFYQVLTTTSAGGGFWESFMGTEATDQDLGNRLSSSAIFREDGAPHGTSLVERGYLNRKPAPPKPPPSADVGAILRVRRRRKVFDLPGGFNKPAHQPHLENFFAAVRGKAQTQLRRPPRLRERSAHLSGSIPPPSANNQSTSPPNNSPYENTN